MNKFMKSLAVPIMLSLSAGVSAAPIVVDFFDDGAQSITDGSHLDATAVVAAEVGPFGSIIGGYRDMSINCNAGCAGTAASSTTLEVSGGLLRFANGSGVDGTGVIAWDGVGSAGFSGGGGTGTGLDITALGGLTAFEVTTVSSDGGGLSSWNFSVLLTDASGDFTNVEFVATQVISGTGPVVSYIDFDLFSSPGLCGYSAPGFLPAIESITCGANGAGDSLLDMTDLDSIVLTLNLTGIADVDLRLDGVRAVPEPSPLALLGIGLLVLGGLRLRGDKNLNPA